jgi:peptidoglycan/LPS O-acetylase OafA/YrhL
MGGDRVPARLRSLDGFRAVAVLAVILSHAYFGQKLPALELVSGYWGVTFFFVISGYLITTLLLREQDQFGHISVTRFYMRRALRIMPVAYLFLACLMVLNVTHNLTVAPKELLTAAVYGKNLPIPGTYDSWYLGHFWSLAVEEQYYLWCPLLLMLGRRAFIAGSVMTLVAAHLVVYLYFAHFRDSQGLLYLQKILGPQASLIVGSLGAVAHHRWPHLLRTVHPAALWALLIGSMVLHAGYLRLPNLVRPTAAAVMMVLLIIVAVRPSNDLFHRFLNCRPMVRIGVYSYSLYIWQQLFTHKVLIFAPEHYGEAASRWLNLAVLFIVAAASYHLFEKRFLMLKDRWQVRGTREAVRSPG